MSLMQGSTDEIGEDEEAAIRQSLFSVGRVLYEITKFIQIQMISIDWPSGLSI